MIPVLFFMIITVIIVEVLNLFPLKLNFLILNKVNAFSHFVSEGSLLSDFSKLSSSVASMSLATSSTPTSTPLAQSLSQSPALPSSVGNASVQSAIGQPSSTPAATSSLSSSLSTTSSTAAQNSALGIGSLTATIGVSLSSPMFTNASSVIGQKQPTSFGAADPLSTLSSTSSSISGPHLVSGSSLQSQVSDEPLNVTQL